MERPQFEIARGCDYSDLEVAMRAAFCRHCPHGLVCSDQDCDAQQELTAWLYPVEETAADLIPQPEADLMPATTRAKAGEEASSPSSPAAPLPGVKP